MNETTMTLPKHRECFGTLMIDNNIYLFGGYNENNEQKNDTFRIEIDTKIITKLNLKTPYKGPYDVTHYTRYNA